jgi:hypothetical protein
MHSRFEIRAWIRIAGWVYAWYGNRDDLGTHTYMTVGTGKQTYDKAVKTMLEVCMYVCMYVYRETMLEVCMYVCVCECMCVRLFVWRKKIRSMLDVCGVCICVCLCVCVAYVRCMSRMYMCLSVCLCSLVCVYYIYILSMFCIIYIYIKCVYTYVYILSMFCSVYIYTYMLSIYIY